MPLTPIHALVVFALTLLPCFSAFSQQNKFQVQGYVKDAEQGTPLPGATVYVRDDKNGVYTTESGHFLLTLREGNNTIIFSFVGYKTDSITITVNSDLVLNQSLQPLSTVMNEVTISTTKDNQKLTETQTGYINIKREEIENMPYLLGEVDPIRIIQIMPGVQTGSEGNTGFYVRGGSNDQNLMLLDNSVVYNPSHLFGFFSVFNGSTLQSIDLYKGGIPAYYGGRLSSITKINTRKGSFDHIKAEGSIGIIATNLVVEGPIKKNRGSFMVGARRTYIDLFIDPLRKLFDVEEKIDYFFYDLNVNIDYNIGAKDYLSLRTYGGKDKFTFGTGSGFSNDMKWGNKTGSINWTHAHRENATSELSFSTTLYDMDFGARINTYNFNIVSNIKDWGISYQHQLSLNKHQLTSGLTYIKHFIKPNNINAYSEDVQLDLTSNIKLHSSEASAYVNDQFLITDNLELMAGIRVTTYSQLGNFTRYIEDDNFQILDTVSFKSGTRIKTYTNPEPRLALRYSLNSKSSVKVSYDKSYQYMHMAPLSSASLPMDVWVPSSTVIKPQSADQYSAGYFRNLSNNNIETSVVLYYKNMSNQIEYRDGVIIGYSKGFNYDDNFVFGKGTSYGSEFLVKKSKGRLNGSIAYTLSRTTRKFNDLNNGRRFRAKYDRLHDLSVMANYTLNKKWSLSAIFVYGTGNALNLPIARYLIQGNVINEYGSRNAFRMPAYHRMDLGATYTIRKTGRFESACVFSIYNVYNRRNPYYIYFETKGNLQEYKLETNLKQVSLFPVIPSVTYRVKFL